MAYSLVLPLMISMQLLQLGEAARGTVGGPAALALTPAKASVRSPEETCDVEALQSPEQQDDTCEAEADVASFIFAGTELYRSPAGMQTAAASEAGASAGPARPLEASTPLLMEASAATGWEATFAQGVHESKMALEVEEALIGSWMKDAGNSDAAVPARIMRAETMMQAADEAPTELWKAKTAERALRMYYHAKWLAERNYARAAEWRYREAARMARSCRRSVLASHSLARLGYFLLHWRREEEAKEVLQESMTLNTKSNPLAPYLHGVLKRKASLGDIERLRDAEEAILSSGEQPSEELELERSRLVEEINYWRVAEGSSRQCLASSDAAYVLICLCGHAAAFLKQVFLR
jgi:hypothetical protein